MVDEGDNKRSPKGLIDEIGEALAGISKLFGILLAIAYVVGFVVVNAGGNLSSLDDIGLFSGRYIAAGFLLILYLGVIAALPGRAFLNVRKQLEWRTKMFAERGHYGLWPFILWVDSILNVTFLMVLAVVILSSVSGFNVPYILVTFAMALYFLVDYTFDWTDLDLKTPRLYIAIRMVFAIAVVWVFFELVFVDEARRLFAFVAILCFALNLVLDRLERFKTNPSDYWFMGTYGAFFLIATAGYFGFTLFGDVHPRLGGGLRPQVEIFTSAGNRKNVIADADQSNFDPVIGKLVVKNRDVVIVETDDGLLTFPISGTSLIRVSKIRRSVISPAQIAELRLLANWIGIESQLDEFLQSTEDDSSDD